MSVTMRPGVLGREFEEVLLTPSQASSVFGRNRVAT
jgi:hypothetical protein